MLRTLWRIALRNAKRHPAQAWAAGAAVAVGVTVLAAALLAGQAAQAGITQIAFDILGESDELVRTEGDFFFPEAAADHFAQGVADRRGDVAVGPAIAHVSVATTPDGLTEPDTLMIGLPPDDPGFGSFQAVAGADRLTAGGGALVNEQLAERLALSVGDPLDVRFSPPVDPVVPELLHFPGNITSARPGPLPPGLPGAPDVPDVPGDPTVQAFEVEVGDQVTRVVAALFWASPQNVTDLDVSLVSPDGSIERSAGGSAGSPDAPAILIVNVTEAGTWTARVTAKAAVDQPFRLVVVLLRPAFSIDELREARDQFRQFEDGPLADQLRAATGAGGATTRVHPTTVAGIVARDGKGGFLGEPAVFLPLDEVQGALGRPGDVNLIRVSNPGGPRAGLALTDEIVPVLDDALNATKAAFPDASVQALLVEPTKQRIVERAEIAGAGFTRFLTTLSSFTITAGVLLVVNLFTMLGEERRVELSVSRALGMRRRHVVTAITMEGALYTLPGAPIGAVMGLGLAYGLIEAVNAFVVNQDSLPIPFVVDPLTLLWAALAGALFTIAAVAVTGWRLSKLHIASGLKGLPDPGRSRRLVWAWALAGLGVVMGLAYIPTGLYTLLVLGPSAVLYGGAVLVGRAWPAHKARFLGAALVLPYGLWTILAFVDVPQGEAPFIAPIRGTMLVIIAVILLLNLPGLPRLLKGSVRRLGKLAPATMVAMAYPTKRQLRTGLTASMFALVLLVLAVFSTFFNVFTVDPDREAGGYDIYAETSLAVDDLDAWARQNLGSRPASMDDVALVDELVVARVVGGDIMTIEGQPVQYNGPPIDWFYGVDAGFAEHNGYDLVSRVERFDTDEAAYRALVEEPGTIIVSRTYDIDELGRLGAIRGGETLTLELASGELDFTVLGAQEQLFLGGVFLDRETVLDLFPTRGSGFLIRVNEGADSVAVARALERDFQEMGLDVQDIRMEARELQELNARFFTVLQVFLGLGLVIGVASLGIVTAKSALEREHELGVLRALGLPRGHITWTLVSEAMLTALLGIVPGIFIGVAVSYAAFVAFFADAGVPFTVPWSSILWLSAISLAATLASTIPPARRAARANAAKAVRINL